MSSCEQIKQITWQKQNLKTEHQAKRHTSKCYGVVDFFENYRERPCSQRHHFPVLLEMSLCKWCRTYSVFLTPDMTVCWPPLGMDLWGCNSSNLMHGRLDSTSALGEQHEQIKVKIVPRTKVYHIETIVWELTTDYWFSNAFELLMDVNAKRHNYTLFLSIIILTTGRFH